MTDPHPLPGQDILKSLDVVELELTSNPAYDDKRTRVGYRMVVEWTVSSLHGSVQSPEMSDRFKIVFP